MLAVYFHAHYNMSDMIIVLQYAYVHTRIHAYVYTSDYVVTDNDVTHNDIYTHTHGF